MGESARWEAVGREAANLVEDGMRIGLGTGRAANAFVRSLGERVAAGLAVTAVATSEATGRLANELGIPTASLDDMGVLDLTVDGADEVAPNLDLIKGLGGALVREKIVAASSRRLVIVVGAEKLASRLGERAPVPVEVVAFGMVLVRRELRALGAEVHLRPDTASLETPFTSDNGNPILDARFDRIDDAEGLERSILAIPGVVGTGLFLGMADRVLVQDGEAVRTLDRP